MRRIPRLALAAIVVLGIAAAVTAAIAAVGTHVTRESTSEAAASAPTAASVPGGLLVWMEPPESTSSLGTQRSDGTIYARVWNAQGEALVSNVTQGVAASLVTGGEEPVIMTVSYDCRCHFFRLDRDGGAWQEILSLSESPVAVTASASSVAYTAIDNRETIVARSLDDVSSTLRLELPSLDVDKGSSDMVTTGPPVSNPRSVVATALVAIGENLVAFSGNQTSCQVTDLPSGKTEAVRKGEVNAACAGVDGNLYAALSGPSKGATLRIVQIDPATLKVTSTFDTDWTPTPQSAAPRLNKLRLLATSDGVALFVSELPQYPDVVAPTHVWVLKNGELSETASLPMGTGIDAGYGSDGSLLLFGGIARESVSRLDLTTGKVTAAEQMTSPDKTWVLLAAE